MYTARSDSLEKSLGSRIVKSLTELLKHKFHLIYFDNFFTSEQLLVELEDGIYACGMARKDCRDFPAVLKQVKFKEKYIYTYMYMCLHVQCISHVYNNMHVYINRIIIITVNSGY